MACACSGGCLAGHGDDDFAKADDDELRARFDRFSKAAHDLIEKGKLVEARMFLDDAKEVSKWIRT